MTREAPAFGTRTGEVALDWPAVIARQHAIVGALRPTAGQLEKAGIRVVLGEAAIVDAHTLRVDTAAADVQEVRGDRMVIAAGSTPVIPRVDGRELGLTSDDLLFLPDFPARLVLVGAGAIGLEMASAFADLGGTVTVMAQEPEILPGFDEDVAAYLRGLLEARGVVFRRETSLTGLAGQRGDVTVRFATDGSAGETRATAVAFAAGRRFRPSALGAEHLALRTSRLGLATDAQLRTSLAGVYAAGDAAGNSQLTTTAAAEGRVAATNALRGDALASDLSTVPQVIFTTPEIARVGLTHREALARGIPCHVSKQDTRGASSGVATGEDAGFFKLVFEAGTERLLGVQMVSFGAAELIQLAAAAIRAGATAAWLAAQISVHPTHAERLIKISAHDYHDICEV